MKHFGDITKLSGYTLPIVDVITGGSPCQDLSVAGKRAGLAGERSGLFMEQMRIVKEMRERDRANGRTGWMVRPRYMVWENVPGAFSSGSPKGADFAAVIEEIIKVAEPGTSVSVCVPNGGWTKSGCYYAEDGSWSIAWRVHDAQFWGVPQRRKRISLVADFGGLSAPEILFERKGLSRDSEPCGAERKETAGATASGTGNARSAGFCRGQSARTRGIGYQIEQSPTIPNGDVPLVMESAGAAGEGVEGASCYGLDHVMLSGGTTYQGRGYYDNVSGCLKTQPHGVCESFSIDKAITTGGNCTAGGDCIHSEYTPALTTDRPHAVCETISFQERGGKPGGGKGILIQHEHVGALSTLNNQSVLSFDPSMSRYAGTVFKDVAKTLTPGTSPGHHDAICTKEPILLESNQSVLAYGIDQQGGKGGANYTEDVCPPILSDSHGTPHAVAYGISSYDSNAMKSSNPHSGIYEADTARTLDLNGGSPACNQGGIAVVQPVVGVNGDIAGTLDANYYKGCGERQGVEREVVVQPAAVCVGNGQLNQMSMAEQANTLDTMHDQQAVLTTVGALCARDYKGVGNQYVEEGKVIPQNAIVRRLTPLECERLQGYPDGWTDIGEWVDSNGKKHKDADSPRYKALGNSIALPFWQWMARRICAQYERTVTMASLFDGIGGFPLVFQRCGAVPVWASEIEEFPIAVTKVRFPDESV